MSETFAQKDRKRDIKYFLENNLNVSYKKGSSTTITGASNNIKIIRWIF